MKNYIFITLTVITVIYSSLASAVNPQVRDDWRPDPLCPYPGPDHTVYLEVDGDCTSYYECWDGTKTKYKCDDGLWWNERILTCDYPGTYCRGEDIRCRDYIHHFWPYYDDCTRFIECYEGQGYQMLCPQGLFFSESRQECVNRRDSDCCSLIYCG